MTTIDILFDPHRSKELYTKYFRFERKRAFEKVPIKLLYGIWGVLVITGISFRIDALWIIGLISAALTSAFLLYYVIRFQIAFNTFLKELEKKAKSGDVNFQFGFDSENMVYKSENVYSEIKWNRIKEYAINGEDIYLYLENRELLDIISKRILGETMFDRFKSILLETCK